MGKILIFKDGTEEKIVKDDGRFWETENSRYNKSNPDIVRIETVKNPPQKKTEKENKK